MVMRTGCGGWSDDMCDETAQEVTAETCGLEV